jgi:ankyrin repeat protein
MDITELLLKYKADVRVKDIFGLSIAHHAIDANDTNTLMYCLEKGIHTETRDNFGNTLLLRAIISNASINLIKMLLDNKASTTAKDKRNLSVLYHVRLKNNDELVELLFNYKPKTKTNVKQKISQTIQRIIVTQKIKTDADDESDIDESYDMFN